MTRGFALCGMTETTVAVPDAGEFERLDAYWRAANYLSVGQIYLLDNPLLKEPLQRAHIKQRMRDNSACATS